MGKLRQYFLRSWFQFFSSCISLVPVVQLTSSPCFSLSKGRAGPNTVAWSGRAPERGELAPEIRYSWNILINIASCTGSVRAEQRRVERERAWSNPTYSAEQRWQSWKVALPGCCLAGLQLSSDICNKSVTSPLGVLHYQPKRADLPSLPKREQSPVTDLSL